MVAALAPTLERIEIEGPESVSEGAQVTYKAVAFFSDGTSDEVDADDWDENSSSTTINSSGRLTASQVSGDKSVTVSATYTLYGVEKAATKRITVVDTNPPPTLQSLAIDGSGWVNEGSSKNYTALAIYSDGSTATVTPNWSSSGAGGSISSTGILSAQEVAADQVITITAGYSSGGITREATKEVLLIDGAFVPSIASLEISGPVSINEGTSASYEAIAHLSDGTSQAVLPAWTENSGATSISSYGLLVASYVSANAAVTISASHTISGVSRSASLSVSVIDVPDTHGPGLAIETPANGAEFSTPTVQLTGVASDFGFGNNGVSSVTVNGAAATGGNAAGGSVASWSASVVLAAGSNPIAVIARDALGNSATASIELTLVVPDFPPNFTWAIAAGGSGDDRIARIAVDQEGGVVCLLQYRTDLSVGGRSVTDGSGGTQTVVAKFDTLGVLQWLVPLHSPEVIFGEGLSVSPGGRILVGGYFGTSCQIGQFALQAKGNRDVFVTNLDPSGRIIWARGFGSPTGSSNDRGYLFGANILSDGSSVLAGYFLGNIGFGASSLTSVGDRDAFVAKLDPNGNPAWAVSGGGAGVDRAFEVSSEPAGGFYVAGDFTGNMTWAGANVASSGSTDGFVARLGSDGSLSWLRSFGGTDVEKVTGLEILPGGSPCVAGEFSGTAAFGSSSITSAGAQDAFLARFEPNGSASWAKSFGGTNSDIGYDVATARDGTIYLSATMSESVSFAGQNHVAVGDLEPVVAAYSPTGSELGMKAATGITSPDVGFGRRLTTDWVGNIYMSGLINGGLRFGTSELQTAPSLDQYYDLFIAKLGSHSLLRPDLRIARNGSQIQLTWPSGWNDWILETTSTLDNPASWQELTTAPVEQAGNLNVSATVQGPKRFYRLRLR